MPVTLNLCNTDPVGFSKSTCVDSVNKLFVSAAMKEKDTDMNFPFRSRPTPTGAPAYSETLLAHQLKTNEDTEEVHQRSNGLVHALEAAYSNHRHLVLRPDDVWHAILTQFSIYVNKNSERLRSTFVEHEGQKTLVVQGDGTIFSADYAELARQMGKLLGENLNDPDLGAWITPDFTTTTTLDITVASVVMMATFKSYFKYKFELCCGIPSVTLLGTRDDWVKLRARVEKFDQFGYEPTKWAALLRPVCDQFIACFDAEGDGVVFANCVDFWSKVCHRVGWGSGPRYLCGWATVFCAWSDEGEWQGNVPDAHHSHAQYVRGKDLHHCPAVNANDITGSVAEVPVIVDDNGTVYNTVMLAGLPGFQVAKTLEGAVSPLVGWAMYLINE